MAWPRNGVRRPGKAGLGTAFPGRASTRNVVPCAGAYRGGAGRMKTGCASHFDGACVPLRCGARPVCTGVRLSVAAVAGAKSECRPSCRIGRQVIFLIYVRKAPSKRQKDGGRRARFRERILSLKQRCGAHPFKGRTSDEKRRPPVGAADGARPGRSQRAKC